MFGKKVFAAMLATVLGASLFGANAAKAVINLDAMVKPAVAIYATETLADTDTVAGHDDYSVVHGEGALLDVVGKVGLAGPGGSFVTVRFDLRGMVFNEAPALEISDGHEGTPSLRTGGAGEAFVSFIANRSTTDNDADTNIVTLTVNGFGVKPGVNGSVTMTVTDGLGDDAVYTERYDDAVRTAEALTESPIPKGLVATVEERFKMFRAMDGTTTTMGTLGSFMVGMVTPALMNADGTGAVDLMADIIATGMDSSVTISGDFSFAEMAWLQTAEACTTQDAMNLLPSGEDEMVMDKLMEQTPADFAAMQYLCISVDAEGDDAFAIPETDPYIVTTKYGAPADIADAAFPASGGEHALGSITRDGTTVHIPFLTTWADYNQRIVISNRGANPAPYWITFRPEEGVTATPNDMYAMGTLDGNSTIVLRAMDVVTLEGRTRTAATFVAEAQSSQIDVATVIVNLVTGSTDTVNYDSD